MVASAGARGVPPRPLATVDATERALAGRCSDPRSDGRPSDDCVAWREARRLALRAASVAIEISGPAEVERRVELVLSWLLCGPLPRGSVPWPSSIDHMPSSVGRGAAKLDERR